MWQKNFLFSSFTTLYRYLKSRIFHGVKSKMFHTDNHTFFLYSFYQCSPHFTKKEGILPVYFLRSSPAWMIRQIYTYTSKKICSFFYRFFSLSNLFFQFRIKSCASHSSYRKTGRFFSATDNSSCSICKIHRRNSFFFYSTCTIRDFIIMHFYFFLNRSSYLFSGLRTTHQGNFFFQSQPS